MPHFGICPSRALYNVLVVQSLGQYRTVSSRLPVLTHRARSSLQPVCRRQFSQSATKYMKRVSEKRALWNDEIPARYVKLVNDEGRLNEPEPLRELLASVDPKEWRLECMEKIPNDPDFDRRYWEPVCKLINIKEEYAKERAKKAEKKKTGTKKAVDPLSVKTLELNWAIDVNNDLNHRLNKVKEFLAEGRRVEIVLAKKKRGRVATREECDNVLDRIKAVVEEVKGARQLKPMEGKVGAVAMLLLEGPKPS